MKAYEKNVTHEGISEKEKHAEKMSPSAVERYLKGIPRSD